MLMTAKYTVQQDFPCSMSHYILADCKINRERSLTNNSEKLEKSEYDLHISHLHLKLKINFYFNSNVH